MPTLPGNPGRANKNLRRWWHLRMEPVVPVMVVSKAGGARRCSRFEDDNNAQSRQKKKDWPRK
jgi:hypothetical protein